MIEFLVKIILGRTLLQVICECNKACKIDDYLDI